MKNKMKSNRETVIVVDGNNLLLRCYYKFSGMVSKKGKPSSMVFGYPYVLKSLLTRFNPIKVYNVFDGGKHEQRLKILPTYKKRDLKLGFDIEDFKDQKSVVMNMLYNMNMQVIFKIGHEADDFIYMLSRKLSKKYNVIIISSDKDFNQLLNENVSCFNPHRGIPINHKNVKRHFNYEASECVDFLILDGDNSDNIPGYKGMGQKRIREFLNEYSSIKNYLSNNCSYKNINNKLLAEIYYRNRCLIDLAYYYRRFLRNTPIPKHFGNNPIFNNGHLYSICDIYDINTFLKPEFQKPFKRLKP